MRILCLFFVFGLVILVTSGCGGAREEPIVDTLDPELKEGEPDATAVLFSRAMCEGAEEQRRLLEMMERRTDGKVKFRVVDVGTQTRLGRIYGIKTVPSMILFDKDGKKVFGKQDIVSEAEIISELNKLGIEVAPLPKPEGGAPPEEPESESGGGAS